VSHKEREIPHLERKLFGWAFPLVRVGLLAGKGNKKVGEECGAVRIDGFLCEPFSLLATLKYNFATFQEANNLYRFKVLSVSLFF
jgi:hypothetical protein